MEREGDRDEPSQGTGGTPDVFTARDRVAPVIGRSPMSLYETDSALRYTWIAGARFGLDAQAIVGKRDGELLPAEQVAELVALKRRALEEERPQRKVIETQVDGRAHAFDVYVEPFVGDDGVIAGLRVATFEVTEQVENERRLREADRRKDAFIAMLGHELRNPLAAIRGASEVFGSTAATDEQARRARSVLDRQTKHMAKLVDGILDVSRIARGKVELERRVLDLAALLTEAAGDWKPRAGELDLELSTTVPDAPAWVHADPVRLVQVLDNLIGNAMKFTPAPGSVSVVLEPHGESGVEVRVRDSGVGIRTELLPQVVEPFRQEAQDTARVAGGLGLGLALSKGLVELHGGSLVVSSEGLGRGTTVSVRLPSAEPEVESAETTRRAEVPSRSILLVEDQADAGEMLKLILETKGHRVRLVTDAPAALEHATEEPPDLVLCDLGLPEMDGYAFARALRNQPELRHLPLVALTGYGHSEARDRARAAGFDAHFVKPLDADALDGLLRDLVPGSEG